MLLGFRVAKRCKFTHVQYIFHDLSATKMSFIGGLQYLRPIEPEIHGIDAAPSDEETN